MADSDFKLSVDVSANLAKLDNALAQAEQKASVSARRMEGILSLGRGAAISSAIIAGGTALGQGLAALRQNELAGNLSGMAGGASGTFGALAARNEALSSIPVFGTGFGIGNRIVNELSLRQGGGRQNKFMEIVFGRSPFTKVGGEAGDSTDFAALAAFYSQEQQRQMKLIGGFPGSYGGALRQFDTREQLNRISVEQARSTLGVSAASVLSSNLRNELNQDRRTLAIQRDIQMTTLKGQTNAARLESMGLRGFADIQNIYAGAYGGITTAEAQNDPELASALRQRRNAAVVASVMGGMSAGQAITPYTEALGAGSVRVGGMSGQGDRVSLMLDAMQRIADNTNDISILSPTISRN